MPHINESFQQFFDDFVTRTATPLGPDSPSSDSSSSHLPSSHLRDAIVSASYPGLLDEPRDPELAEILKSPELQDSNLPPLSLAGLWLLAGDLDRSHSISQADSSAEGSFWHGIMHRREGDYSNAKYWFRRVGDHPVLMNLADHHPGVFSNPYQFIDDVEKACGGRSADPAITQSLLQVQWTEWQLLMQHGGLDLESTGQRSE